MSSNYDGVDIFMTAFVFLLCGMLLGCILGIQIRNHTAESQMDRIRNEAVKNNCAEYFIDDELIQQFKWINPEEK